MMMPMTTTAIDLPSPSKSWSVSLLSVGAILVASGIIHLALLGVSGGAWEGPTSLRKPGLFGLSAGVTAWSLAWAIVKLRPHPFDRFGSRLLAVCLLVEVGLITLQQWRGVPSHFNRATQFDAAIEAIMLAMILLVTAGVCWLSFRSIRLPPLAASTASALRGGLWLLAISCILGIGVTVLGEINRAQGRALEVWGQAGVLKYPHGAAMHAIQVLAILDWLLSRLRSPFALVAARSAIASHAFFLIHAIWQTAQGRARHDLDFVSVLLVSASIALLAASIAATAFGYWTKYRRTGPPTERALRIDRSRNV